MYSCTFSLTSALSGGVLSMPHHDRFAPPGEARCQLYRGSGWPQGRSGQADKIPPLNWWAIPRSSSL